MTLRRRDVVELLLRERGDTLLVTGLGAPTWDAAACGEHPNDFYLWGAMGGAATTGLGLALAQPGRRVLVLTGDGEMLMGLGSLATIGVQGPRNLAVAVLDNHRYGETGMQLSHTEFGVDLSAVAEASGFRASRAVRDAEALSTVVPLLHHGDGPVFAAIEVDVGRDPMVLPEKDGEMLKSRFRRAVLNGSA